MGACGRHLLRLAPLTAALALLCALPAGQGSARADIFFLRDGGQIEGQLLGSEGDLVRIKTAQAEVSLAKDDVVRVQAAPETLKLYQRMARDFPKTADGHYRLGVWCRQRDLGEQARAEFARAIALEPDHALARAALGHVRIGSAWLEPAPTGQPASAAPAAGASPGAAGGAAAAAAASGPAGLSGATPPTQPDEDDPRAAIELARASLQTAEREMMQTLRGEWLKRIRAIQSNYLSSPIRRQFNQGAEMLLAIRDPLAVEPMLQVLSDGPAEQRKLLMVVLGQFQASAATMGLLEASVLDEDGEVRKVALNQLMTRSDPRVSAFLVKALASEDYDVMINAATALGHLRVVSAVPDLVRELTARETRRTRTETVVRTMRQHFIDETGQLRTLTVRRTRNDPFSQPRSVTVTVYRTEVQEALIAITGKNYGFDGEGWMDWYRRHAAEQR